VYIALRKFPYWRKRCSVIGFIILLGGLVGASFANTIPQLIATQGVMYAIRGSIHYYPVFLYLDEWFVARKAWRTALFGLAVALLALPFL